MLLTDRISLVEPLHCVLSVTHRQNIRRFKIGQIVLKSMTHTQTNSNFINIDCLHAHCNKQAVAYVEFFSLLQATSTLFDNVVEKYK